MDDRSQDFSWLAVDGLLAEEKKRKEEECETQTKDKKHINRFCSPWQTPRFSNLLKRRSYLCPVVPCTLGNYTTLVMEHANQGAPVEFVLPSEQI